MVTKKVLLCCISLVIAIWGFGLEVSAQKAMPTPIKIVIDPGHGGKDPGAIGVNGIYEKNVNLSISFYLRDLLVAQGFDVVMTREDDRLLVNYTREEEKAQDLQARVDVATRERADLFISIHANSYPEDNNIQGTMVLYYDPANYSSRYKPSPQMVKWSIESRRLAQMVLNSVTTTVHTKSLGVIPRNVYVVRAGTVPSILVETAFLSNWEEAQKLADPGFQRQVAEAIASAVTAYHPYRYVDIVDHWAKEEISTLSLQGIIQGYTDGTFHPDQSVTRAELVQLLDRAIGFEGLEKVKTGISFPDVEEDFWGREAIEKAAETGIINGYPDGSFRPNDPVTREELAVIIYRLLSGLPPESAPQEGSSQEGQEGSPSGNTSQEGAPQGSMSQKSASQVDVSQKSSDVTDDVYQIPSTSGKGTQESGPTARENLQDKKNSSVSISSLVFRDVPESNWAASAIQALYEQGLVRGMKPDYFGFGKQVTRAEAATLLYRLLKEEPAPPLSQSSGIE